MSIISQTDENRDRIHSIQNCHQLAEEKSICVNVIQESRSCIDGECGIGGFSPEDIAGFIDSMYVD